MGFDWLITMLFRRFFRKINIFSAQKNTNKIFHSPVAAYGLQSSAWRNCVSSHGYLSDSEETDGVILLARNASRRRNYGQCCPTYVRFRSIILRNNGCLMRLPFLTDCWEVVGKNTSERHRDIKHVMHWHSCYVNFTISNASWEDYVIAPGCDSKYRDCDSARTPRELYLLV